MVVEAFKTPGAGVELGGGQRIFDQQAIPAVVLGLIIRSKLKDLAKSADGGLGRPRQHCRKHHDAQMSYERV